VSREDRQLKEQRGREVVVQALIICFKARKLRMLPRYPISDLIRIASTLALCKRMGQMAVVEEDGRGVKTIIQVYNMEVSFINRAEADLLGKEVFQIGVSAVKIKAKHVHPF
jgi:hypothetical protein